MTFGEKLKAKRAEFCLSQKDLCEKLGISLRTLTGWETEGRYPRKREFYAKLAEVFSCDINYFLTEGKMAITPESSLENENLSMEGAQETLNQAKALFAGDRLSKNEKLQFLSDIQALFLNAHK